MAEPRGISQLEWRTTDSAPVHIRFKTSFGKLGRFSTTREKSLRHCASGPDGLGQFNLLIVLASLQTAGHPHPQESQGAAQLSSPICDPNATELVDLVILRAHWQIKTAMLRVHAGSTRSIPFFSAEATDQDHVARLGRSTRRSCVS